jgi:hypothetical protein
MLWRLLMRFGTVETRHGQQPRRDPGVPRHAIDFRFAPSSVETQLAPVERRKAPRPAFVEKEHCQGALLLVVQGNSARLDLLARQRCSAHTKPAVGLGVG